MTASSSSFAYCSNFPEQIVPVEQTNGLADVGGYWQFSGLERVGRCLTLLPDGEDFFVPILGIGLNVNEDINRQLTLAFNITYLT